LDPRRPPTVDEASIAHPIEYALRSNESNDVIFLGDSTCHDGVDPVMFQPLTGLRAYNLGSQGGLGPLGLLLTAKAYLSNHPKPRAAVLCVSPFCFERDAVAGGGELPARFAANYGPEVAGVIPIGQSIAYFIKRGVVSLLESQDHDVRNEPLLGMEKETFRTLDRKTRHSRGFFRLAGLHGPKCSIDRPGPPKLIHDDWDHGVRGLAHACDDVGVALVIRFMPIAREFADARDFASLEIWSRELESSFTHTKVVRPILLIYDSPFMWDCIHLNAAGVEKFMPMLATDVQDALKR
jgi:hypothetical protein